ncbi:MAG: hypothetical protein OQK42_04900 [Sedimenticola sp.]|uniref:DUF998 domain-containing protein n=1 Tax=Sedimenticola thiotaurini TaxID=1543721 RepID=A0A558CFG7_9GAMM|nr:hypothetical protein [Sedimenticola sp.]MCW8949102.1 hypothetical protein [Sedimenticola sp.]MCW8975288.1 hypothetical protein [Sedimenticola sp.]MCW9022286.1 hypothetical protein [Sedimenticola sp.]TVT47517.1 MAG: hypothetical protein FHK82_18085 [Sedimenticola thiotaurini]
MQSKIGTKPISIWIASIIALVFGLLTIKSGGSVLFFDGAARENAGNYVPFVLWFNFVIGFVYLIAGAGLFKQQRWSVWLSIVIALTTLVVFGFLGLHIMNDGLYEARTVGAMILRTTIWIIISITAYLKIIRQ